MDQHRAVLAYRAGWQEECAVDAAVSQACGLVMAAHMPLTGCVPVKISDSEQTWSLLLTSLACILPHLPQSLHV